MVKNNKRKNKKEMMENKKTPTTQRKFRTYFDNNLVVMKDKIMFCLLFKLVSLHQLKYNKAEKDGKPTDNIKFQYSINEFILDTQISRSSVLRKLAQLEKLQLITKSKTKEDNNANGKNEYQLNINYLDEIVSNLNTMKKRKERIEYINQIFNTTAEKEILSIKESEEPVEVEKEVNSNQPSEDTSITESATTTIQEGKVPEIKNKGYFKEYDKYINTNFSESFMSSEFHIKVGRIIRKQGLGFTEELNTIYNEMPNEIFKSDKDKLIGLICSSI